LISNSETVKFLQTFTKVRQDRIISIGTIRNKSEERIPGTNKTVTRIRGVYFEDRDKNGSSDFGFKYRDRDDLSVASALSKYPTSNMKSRQSRF
jgi:hypothetical protein